MKNRAGKRIIACLLCLAVFAGSELTGLTNIVGALSATEVSTVDDVEGPDQKIDTIRVEAPPDSGDSDITEGSEDTGEDGADNGNIQPGIGDDESLEDSDDTKTGGDNGPGEVEDSGEEEPGADNGQSVLPIDDDKTDTTEPDGSGSEEPKENEDQSTPTGTEDGIAPAEDGENKPAVNDDDSIQPGTSQETATDPEAGEPDADGEPKTEEAEEDAAIYDKFQEGSLEDLMNVEKETVTAAMTLTETASAAGRRMARARTATSWNAAAYYVNEDDSYDVTKTDDFSLKYQIEFHTDTEIPAYGVTFRVPGFLLSERDGTEHYADDIAVPRAEDYTDSDGNTQHKDVPAKTISFNYYEETVEGTKYYVFYNYEDLPRGTNAAFQVLYKKMKAMDLVDGSSWNFPVTAEVKPSKDAEETEEKLLATLTGRVDTKAEVTSVTQAPYYSPATSNYTPALYTKKQVDQYATQKTAAYSEIVEENFADYFYAVWSVRLSAEATQGFYVDIKENIPEGGGGRVIGVSYESPYMRLVMQDSPAKEPNQFRIYAIAEGYEWEAGAEGSYYQKVQKADYGTLRIVMAYPREDLGAIYDKVENQSDLNGWKLTSSVTAIVTGVDGQDDPSELVSEEGSFTYREYKWTYGEPSITASKSNAEGGVYSVFNGWNNTYLQAKAAGKDRGSFVFNTSVMMQDYGHTHNVNEAGAPVIEGKYNRLTVADDLLYLSENENGMDYGNTDKNYLLTEDDYYFSSVRVNLKDYDFDIWEDSTKPIGEDSNYICRSTKIYAMYAKPDTDEEADAQGWYVVKSEDRFLDSYTFTPQDLAKEPYRVKVEHESNAHTLSASIKVEVTFRKDSTVLKNEFFTSLEKGVTLENNVGIVRERVEVNKDGEAKYTQFSNTSDILDLKTVRDDEAGLYPEGQIPERYRNYDPTIDKYPGKTNTQGFAYMNPSKPRSQSFKYGTIVNDPVNERVNQRYNLVVYNGYDIYDETVINYMKSAENSTPGVVSSSPGHSEVVFYDLLPLGVKYDPSAEIIAGRITSLDDETIKKYPDAWEKDDVTVTVNREAGDVIDNYQGTGRTLVRFHLSYQKGDPSVFATYKDRRMWMEGWGVSFGSYYSWKDEDVAKDAENIFAFSTSASDEKPLVGSASGPYRVCADNGELPDIDGKDDTAYLPLVQSDGIRGGDKNLKSIIFGKGGIEDGFAKSSQAEILKRVRADDDPYGAFEKEAEVSLGGDYTYEMTVRVTQGEVQGLVVYDCLEKAVSNLSQTDLDKKEAGSLAFDDNWWYGTFNGIVTNELTEKGIAPKIYYSENRDAVRPGAGKSFEEILQEYSDWMEADVWEDAGKSLADVKSIAVDLSKKTDGGDFVLSNMDAVSFQIKMTAPNAFQEKADLEEDQISREEKDEPATWAYNNSSYSCDSQAETAQLNTSDAVRVRLRDSKKLTVEKQVKGEIPKTYEGASFTIRIEQTLEKKEEDGKDLSTYTSYANKSYILYEKDAEGTWVKADAVIRATDANGCLTLKDGQKAELNISDQAAYRVTEVESPFWKQTIDEEKGQKTTNPDGSESPGTDEYTVTNEYRPVLYVQKSVIGCPTTVDKKEQKFRFQLVTVDGNGQETPARDQEYWYVDSSYGDMPQKLGTGRTSKEDGSFVVKPGEILAMFPGDPGTKYIVRETTLPESGDWVVYEGKDEVSGTLDLSANRAVITNLYRWRELAIAKKLTHQDSDECTQPFTFRVEKVTEKEDGTTETTPVSGNAWTLYNADGSEYKDTEGNPVTGTLDANGRFTADCAGKTVRIQKLEAGATYLVSEEVYEDGTSASQMGSDGRAVKGSDYRPLTATLVAEMPVYSVKRELTFTNDYLLRPITVSKTVAYDASELSAEELQELKTKTFTMTIYTRKDETSEWEPYKGMEFTRSGASQDASLTAATDAQGQFTIRNGETITFQDAGRAGLEYKVEEAPDEKYKQIYPVAGTDGSPSPVEASIGSEGGKAVFINGTAGLLMLGKEYTADADDPAAAVYLAKIKEDQELRIKEAVTVTLETKDPDGKWTAYAPEDENLTVTVIDTLATENASKSVTWSALTDEDGALKLEPWKQVVLPMDGETEYRISESQADQGRLYRTSDCGLEGYESGYLAVEARTASTDGTVKSQPVAMLVNEISSVHPVSTVAKAMRGGSTPIPSGERLVLQVQQYTGAEWKPAGGVRYIVTDFDPTVAADRQQELPVSAGVQETGPDGKIVVVKGDDSAYTDSERGTQRYPKIGFVSDVVRPEASAADWKAGDYRLIELLTESGSKWGGWYQSTWDAERSAGTIWNSNRPIQVRIGKALEEGVTDDGSIFTFHLKQVTMLKESAGTNLKADDILASKDAGGIEYRIYDADDNYVGPGQTSASGELRLKAGQYAILEVADATRWTVSEKQNGEMKLTGLTAEKNAGKLAPNLAVINAQAAKVPAYIRAKSDSGILFGTADNIKNTFTVTLVWSDGSEEELNPRSEEDGEDARTYSLETEKQEDGSVKCRFTSVEYENLFDTLILRKPVDGENKDFEYTGEVQTYTVPETGFYQIELWGASGGGNKGPNQGSQGGRGGYVTGLIHLEANTTLYVYVGGQGGREGVPIYQGGWNGGGNGSKYPGPGGGGATDIRVREVEMASLTENEEDPRIIVAGAGGGSDDIGGGSGSFGGNNDGRGGFGGGWEGGMGYISGKLTNAQCAKPGTQNTGYRRGIGESTNTLDCGAGGGGWYGGYGSRHNDGGGAGGSSYISGICETSKTGYEFIDGSTISGDALMLSPDGEEETGHWGDGYARIRRIQ